MDSVLKLTFPASCQTLSRSRGNRSIALGCKAISWWWRHHFSDQRYEFTLNIGVTIDVPLCGLYRLVASQQLYVSQ
jgi:hypothetical protein